MKWILGGLLLAVVASVASGRVPVIWVIYSFAALFASMGGALFFAYSRTKHNGLLVLGIAYFAGALTAVVLEHWWPLVAGFGIAWALRMMGVEPKPEELPESGTPAASTEGEKKG